MKPTFTCVCPLCLGVGAASSFDTLLRQVHGKRDFDADHTCIYHISLPGHSEEEEEEEAAAANGNSPKREFSKNYKCDS